MSLVGYNDVKRRLAAQYVVDPYSTNGVLQDELGDLAWAVFAGEMTFDAALLAAPIGKRAIAITVIKTTADLTDPALEQSAMSLLAKNLELAEQIGLSADERSALMNHPHLSPSHQTVMIQAIGTLHAGGGRGDFLRHASLAGNEAEAERFTRAAALIALLHDRRAHTDQLLTTPFGPELRAEGQLRLIPLIADYVIWDAEIQRLVDLIDTDTEPGGVELWVSGGVSDIAATHLKQRGVKVVTGAFDVLADMPLLPEPPEAAEPSRVAEGSGDKPDPEAGTSISQMLKPVTDKGKEVGRTIGEYGRTLGDYGRSLNDYRRRFWRGEDDAKP
jgi:hypothetical protein